MTVCSGEVSAPIGTVMLPLVTVSVSYKRAALGAPVPDGFVGNGDGAPCGAAMLVVTLTVVGLLNVVPVWNVMLALQAPSVGYAIGEPTVKPLRVPVLVDGGALPHGNAAWVPLVAVAVGDGLGDGCTVPAGT